MAEQPVTYQPTSSIDDLAAYRAGSLGGATKTVALVFSTAF